MSFNQSRADKNEPSQYIRSGRSVNPAFQRNFSGGGGAKGGGGGSTTAPPSSSSSRSFKATNYARGVQPRVSSPNTNVNLDSSNSAPAGRGAVQNGAHLQPPVRGAPEAPVTGATVKSSDVLNQKSTPGLPKAAQGNLVAPSSDATGPGTPTKGPADASRAFPLQFGSISPGLMNGMQIPARTNSAPPSMDEQKQAQARLDSLKATTVSSPAVPKQQLPRKDAGAVDQSNANEAHAVPKAKKNVQASAAPPTTQTLKPSGHPISGVPMQQMPFHKSQLHVQFGGSNPQMQSQGMGNTSLPMPLPMPLPMGNPTQVQQQVFVPGIQHHPMQSQGIIHQGQGMNFSSQMGPPQMPSQLGNMGIGLGSQYSQQQTGKFGPRRTVKITHPDTHEELRLDKRTDGYADGGSSGPRSHPHGPPQSQAIPPFPHAHPMNYYSSSYNASPLFFPPPNSNPLTSAQVTPGSQAPRFYNQVTVRPAASAHGEKAGGSSLPGSSPALDKSEFPKVPRAHGQSSSIHPQRDSETITGSSLQQSKSTPVSMASKPSAATFGSFQSENLTANSSASSAPVEDSASLVNSGAEVAKRTTINKSSSFKEEQKKAGKKVQSVPPDQLPGHHISLDGGIPETLVSSTSSLGTDEGVLETGKKVLSAAGTVNVPGSSAVRSGSGDEGLRSIEIGTENNSDSSLKVEGPNAKTIGSRERGEDVMSEGSKQHEVTTTSQKAVDQYEDNAAQKVTTTSKKTESLDAARSANDETGSLENAHVQQEGPVNDMDDKLATSISTAEHDISNAETSSLNLGSSHGDKISSSDDPVSRFDSRNANNIDITESVVLDQELHAVSHSVPEAPPSSFEGEGTMSNSTGLISPTASSSMDKAFLETNKSKGNTAKGKKKMKEILKNADAQGTTSDLYMAYKGPEEKKETLSAEISESSSGITPKEASVDSSEKDVASDEKRGHCKFEPDDWEDAADISTPKLETSENRRQVRAGLKHHSEDGNDGMTQRYSRDFLLKFSEQFTDLPEGFEITSDIAEALIVSNFDVSRESYPSPGKAADRSAGGSRLDRRTSNLGDDDKWSKIPGPLGSGRDMRLDIGYPGNVTGFRPGQGGNYGVLRNPRAQAPVQYAGGILSGPMQSPAAQVQRNNSDSDRWQRATGYYKGLIPSPQTPMQVMHKAERKYEVGKVTDAEQAKQRQLKGILNKLTPQNFEKLFEQVKQVNIDNAGTLSGVIAQIFDKALMEPTFCEMYANFCSRLAVELPDFSEDNEKITFKRLLLNKCQEEFERGEREQEEANRTEEEGEVKQSEEEREEKRVKARRRMLGNIRLIGELYKKKMLTERIMHECIKKLLGNYQNPDEEDIEALCKLMSTIGEMIDHPRAKEHMDAYFDMMSKLSNNMKLSSRVRFMLKDAIDLRKNKWQQRRKVEGPKKIEEVHRDAAQERQAQSSRLGRGPNLNSSLRRGQPMDFGPRGSNVLPSPNAQMGGFRGLPQQLRGYGNQDARFEERESFENRTLSIPVRPIGDDSITLGPQGGLARGMSIRGQPTMQSMPLPERPSPADSRRAAGGLNGYGSISERTVSGPGEDFISRYTLERFAPPPAYDQLNMQERSMNHVNRDTRNAEPSFQRVQPSSPPARVQVPTSQNVSSDKVFPEERLHDMAMEAIKEFYSARDEKEVALCIKDLNAPSFYPSMISIWVIDSFERKDMERDSLAKLLINLSKPQQGMLSQDSLVRGFESVLATLEDAVNDAPRAAEFLGRIFARVLLEDVIPYKEVWRLIYEGGEEQGRLVEIGLAADVLGVILEIIKSEKGDPFLNEICAGSNLHVENFRPPSTRKSLRLDKFI